MTDMRELYQAVILEHNKKPRNFGVLDDYNYKAHGDNPLCGDNYTVYLKVDENGVVEGVSFDGSGCAISKAAASMMTTKIKGRSVDDALILIEEFRNMLTGKLDIDGDHHLGHLTVFEGVSQLPVRIKCAVLPWHTLKTAIQGDEIASTEGEHDPLANA